MQTARKLLLLVLLSGLCSITTLAQQDSLSTETAKKGTITFSGFVDAYYAYDFHRPANKERPDFLYNHKRHNELNVNLALLKGTFSSDRARASLGLMAGTYPQYNLSHEQEQLRHIWEANAGIRLAKGLWLDAGVFLSHIGFESAISTENFTLTRSLTAENTPYYLSGAKLSYTPEESPWAFTLVVANGWQNMRETENNTNKAVGTQVSYSPSERLTLNSSTFVSNEYADWAPRWRYLHNFYTIYHLNSRLGLIAGVDTGLETQPAGKHQTWWTSTAILRYQVHTFWALAGRVEHYNDPSSIFINPAYFTTPSTEHTSGFRTTGYSLNLDYAPAKNVMWRLEGRLLESREAIFARDQGFSRHNTAITTSVAVSF